jgi:hypothetical protein
MKNKTDLSKYLGALKNNPLLDALEDDSIKIRKMVELRIESQRPNRPI